MEPSTWSVLERDSEYQNDYFEVIRETVELPSGMPNDYYRIGFGGGAIGLGVVDGDVLFVELYRPRLDERLLELPGGGIDAGEEPTEAARREFAEETGYVANTAELLGSFYFTAWSRAKRHYVWLDDFESREDTDAEAEVQDVVRVPVEDAFDVAAESPAGEWNLTPLQLARQRGYLDFD
jgi:ADP-ribose pyrophosphatase